MIKTKINKAIRVFSVILAVAMLVSAVPFAVLAGTVKEQLKFGTDVVDVSNWYDPNDTLQLEGGALVFPNDSTADDRIVSKYSAESFSEIEKVVSLVGNYTFTKLTSGKKFLAVLGVPSLESGLYEPETINIEFYDNNGVKCDVVVYDADGKAQTIVAGKSVGNLNTSLAINIDLFTNKKISLSVNGSQIFKVDTPIAGEGRIAFMQTGGCGVKIANFAANFTKYDTPVNSNIFEDFESGSYNDNAFVIEHSGARDPSYIAVEKYNGNNVLMFRNVTTSNFGTRQSYSNFEFCFDMPYYSRNKTYDEFGNLVIGDGGGWGMTFGDTAVDQGGYQYGDAIDLIYCTEQWMMSHNTGFTAFKENFADKIGTQGLKTDEGWKVRMRVIDGKLTVDMKRYTGTEDYVNIVTHEYENTRTGPFKIWTFIGDGSNFAIDNVKITNLDSNPQLVELTFKRAEVGNQDYVYTPPTYTYDPNATVDEEVDGEEGEGSESGSESGSDSKPTDSKENNDNQAEFPWIWMLITVACGAIAILFVVVCIIIKAVRKKKINKELEE